MVQKKKKTVSARKKPAPAAKKKPVVPARKKGAVSPKAAVAVKKAAPAPVVEDVRPKFKMPAKDRKIFKELLQKLRDRVVDEITFLAGDNLNRSQRESSGDLSSYSFHMADQGTDNFDREFALNLVSSEQDILYEIDEAMGRIDQGYYGSCEACGKPIEKARLNALPFAKMCVGCKSQSEKGKARFRPFGPTISQTVESST
jgi:DnaK suppressor protein